MSNHFFAVPGSAYIQKRQVPSGFDAADNYIVEHVTAGDLVITSDIPLADEVIAKGRTVITTRGQLYTKSNIKQQLAYRDVSDQLRGSGLITGGPPPLGSKEIQQFSNHLDRFLAR